MAPEANKFHAQGPFEIPPHSTSDREIRSTEAAGLPLFRKKRNGLGGMSESLSTGIHEKKIKK